MDFGETFGNLFASFQDIRTIDILVNVVLSAIMSFFIYHIYVRFGTSLSNRKHFGGSFLLITICTTLIIALIKSSIALSLGLVGALSIIRFRTAIKEPQELTYIFFCIAMGLGFGANERLLTISSGFLVLMILLIIGLIKKDKIEESYNITVRSQKLGVDQIISCVSQHCSRVDLRRFDHGEKNTNVLLFVEFETYEKLQKSIKTLEDADPKVFVGFLAARSLS